MPALTPTLAPAAFTGDCAPARPVTRWRWRSLGAILLAWSVLQMGGLFSPGLLDDVDSVYIEIAREMLVRHDFVTPRIDGVRFFDKPPLMYWLAAGSMRVFGVHDWAARLPLALLALALFLATYVLGLRLLSGISPGHAPDRGGLYAALALATSIGPYLYTRFFIPDIVVALWLTLSVHAFLLAIERTRRGDSALPPMLVFGATLALSVLTKGLIGLVFPVGFALFYLVITRQLALVRRLHLLLSAAAMLLIALPWHVLVALRNPAIALPPGLGLPARGGWAWFYLYNEHVARFLSRRIPHDYGQVPIPLFWALAAVWMLPWVAFLPAAVRQRVAELRQPHRSASFPRCREATLALLLWSGLVLGFFTLSARQEYYSLPCLPALALLIGGLLCRADRNETTADAIARHAALAWSRWFLLPFGILLAAVAIVFAAVARPVPRGTDIAELLAHSQGSYNLSLSHLFDLTPAAMGLFCGPLLLVGAAALTIGPVTFFLRRKGRTLLANLSLTIGATGLLLAMHAGLTGFYPTLGSKGLARSIADEQRLHPAANDVILIDGELTAGSSLIFYTEEPVRLVNGRVNGPWYGSFWPDAPKIFEDERSLRALWASPQRVFLLTYHPADRARDLLPLGKVRTLSSAGGKAVLSNQP